MARFITASCNAIASSEGASVATKLSSNSRHKSTKSIQDTTWAGEGSSRACTCPANRPASRPANRFSSGSKAKVLTRRICQNPVSFASTPSTAPSQRAAPPDCTRPAVLNTKSWQMAGRSPFSSERSPKHARPPRHRMERAGEELAAHPLRQKRQRTAAVQDAAAPFKPLQVPPGSGQRQASAAFSLVATTDRQF